MFDVCEKPECATKIMDVLIEEYPDGISLEDIRGMFRYIESRFSNLKVIDLKVSDVIY